MSIAGGWGPFFNWALYEIVPQDQYAQ